MNPTIRQSVIRHRLNEAKHILIKASNEAEAQIKMSETEQTSRHLNQLRHNLLVTLADNIDMIQAAKNATPEEPA